jgi:SAM-dependent methyltransferase
VSSTFARVAGSMFERAMALNLANIETVLASAPADGRLLDLGCADGERTRLYAAAARTSDVHGVEVVPDAAEAARGRGITVTEADLNRPLPLPDTAFDLVVSNQVLEHLVDTDAFVSEVRRVLKPGGMVVTSTENLASWHNVAALLLGWQPFSLGNVSDRQAGLGNPAAIHRAEEPGARSWQHMRVFSYRALRELFASHGLRVLTIKGAGYYPLPARVGAIDPRHAAFLTVVAIR